MASLVVSASDEKYLRWFKFRFFAVVCYLCKLDNVSVMDLNEDLLRAAEAVKCGKVILYPTDTVWGIGCDATDSDAVKRVYAIKRRADSKALLLLVDSIDTVRRYFPGVTTEAEAMLTDTERPTTVILPSPSGIAPELVAADGTVGVRVTREEYSCALCRAAGMPLVSTSANISGEPAAKCYGEISAEIKDAVDYICEARRDEPAGGVPSRIVKFNPDKTITVIRP